VSTDYFKARQGNVLALLPVRIPGTVLVPNLYWLCIPPWIWPCPLTFDLDIIWPCVFDFSLDLDYGLLCPCTWPDLVLGFSLNLLGLLLSFAVSVQIARQSKLSHVYCIHKVNSGLEIKQRISSSNVLAMSYTDFACYISIELNGLQDELPSSSGWAGSIWSSWLISRQ